MAQNLVNDIVVLLKVFILVGVVVMFGVLEVHVLPMRSGTRSFN